MASARFGLPRSQRLQRASEFTTTKASGFRTRDRWFTVFAAVNARAHARLGITVARKVASKAVERNRIKRHVRESFRRYKELLGGHNIVVIAHTPARAASAHELDVSLQQHWRRIAQQCKTS